MRPQRSMDSSESKRRTMKRELAGMSYQEVDEWCKARHTEIDASFEARDITKEMADVLRRWVAEQRAMHLVATCLGLLKGGES